jgi:hypothetical protein
MKFEVAYFRPMHFGDPSREQAATLYVKYRQGGVPTGEDYLSFQDFIFRYLIKEGARLHLPVHIHSAVGIGDYFNISAFFVTQITPTLPSLYDSWRVSAGAPSHLAGRIQKRLHGFFPDGN